MDVTITTPALSQASKTLGWIVESIPSGFAPDVFAASDGTVEAAVDKFRSWWSGVHGDLRTAGTGLSAELGRAAHAYDTVEANVEIAVADNVTASDRAV